MVTMIPGMFRRYNHYDFLEEKLHKKINSSWENTVLVR